MNWETAKNLLISHGMGEVSHSLLYCLQQGYAPPPGQITQILVALRIARAHLKGCLELDRQLVAALYQLAAVAPQRWNACRIGISPLMESDLLRITQAVEAIFMDA